MFYYTEGVMSLLCVLRLWCIGGTLGFDSRGNSSILLGRVIIILIKKNILHGEIKMNDQKKIHEFEDCLMDLIYNYLKDVPKQLIEINYKNMLVSEFIIDVLNDDF